PPLPSPTQDGIRLIVSLLGPRRTPYYGSVARVVLTRPLRRVHHLTPGETTSERRCGSVRLSLLDRLRRLRGQASRNRLALPPCNPRARLLTKLASRCFGSMNKMVLRKSGSVQTFSGSSRYLSIAIQRCYRGK